MICSILNVIKKYILYIEACSLYDHVAQLKQFILSQCISPMSSGRTREGVMHRMTCITDDCYTGRNYRRNRLSVSDSWRLAVCYNDVAVVCDERVKQVSESFHRVFHKIQHATNQ